MDASIRLTTGNLEPLMKHMKTLRGFQLFIRTGHSNFAVTSPGMYDYIVSDIDKLKTLQQLGGGFLAIARTEEIWNNVLKWGVLCSLEESCIYPKHSHPDCNFIDHYTQYANCHRSDQSMFNILVANWHNFSSKTIIPPFNNYIDVLRTPTEKYPRKKCKPVKSQQL